MDAQSGSTSSWVYLDFELEIRRGGPREYPVAVRSPAGEAQGQMRFPFDEWELKDRLQSLEIALLRSGGTRRRIASPEEYTVQDFGRGLFDSLLVGDVRTRYEMSLSEARRQGKGLRLKLRIQPSELAVLPWEFLYDAERDRYPSLSSNTPLVRYLDLPQPVEPLRVSPPLRILGMVASPLGLDPLNVKHEKRLVEEATRGLREGGLLELTWLEGQTWRHLQRAMRRGPWHVFHFVGHGGFDAATEEGAIALANDAGHMHLLRARSLAELLDDHYPLRLVFLNSCEGARGSESDAFSSTAATLVRRGVPAVVAMQYEVTDRAAIEFSRDFYEALADSLPVDAAVTEARAAVSMDSILEWGTPVLYMHSPDGRVFDVLAAAPREHPPPETEESQEVDSLRQYREGVESAWADGNLQANEVQWLKDLANNELRLNPRTAADIEREVMGDTIEAILSRQEQLAEEEERRNQLDQLYSQARRAHRDQAWQRVVELFEEIRAEDPNYPDSEGLLVPARDALDAQERIQGVATLYDRGQRHMKAEEWQQALECLEQVQRLEPDYRETGELLARVRQEFASPPKVEVPDLSGQTLSQARSTLVAIGLKLGPHSEITNDKMPKGQIISQSPGAATDLETGKLVSVTLSSGPRSDVAFGTLRVRYTGIPAGLRGSLELFLDGEEVGNFSTRGQEIEVKSEAGSRSIMVRWLKGTRPILGLSPNVSNSPPLTFQMRSNEVLNFTCGVRVTRLMGAMPFIEHSQTPSSESSSRPEQYIQSLLALLGFSQETPTNHEEPTPWLRNAIVTLLVIGAILFILLVSLYLL
jgi:tetratricopeptide (TPR) repeat protein